MEDIKITEGTILESLNNKADIDGGNYKGSGLEERIDNTLDEFLANTKDSFLNKSQITNCLLEVPQRIKYDLTDGALTIKKGSQVVVPYGTTNENFTRVGSPTIVDGVASGFGSGNYINTGFILSDLYNKKWTIKSRTVYNYMDDAGNLGVTLHSIYNGRQWLAKGQFGIANRTGSIYFYAQTIDGTEGNKISILATDTNIKDGDIVDLELSFDLTTYTLKAIINNSQTIIKSWTPTTEDKNLLGTQTTDPIYINSREGGGTITNSNCSIDLKQFSITVDGKVVYRPYIQKGDRFLNDNFKVYDTQFADGKFFVWAELVGDISRPSFSENGNVLIFVNINNAGSGTNGLGQAISTNVGSGTSDPSKGYYYRTDENKVYHLGIWYGYSLPVMLGTSNGTNLTSIDQVFNGLGYIGSTVWVDKGVKGLTPNGKNEDGTVKNIEWITPKLIYRDVSTHTFRILVLNHNGMDLQFWNSYTYDENLGYGFANGNVQITGQLPIADVVCSNGNFTSFNPKQPFRAVDYNELPITDICTTKATTTSSATSLNPAVVVQNYASGTSWYRVWSDGWIEQGGQTGATASVTVTLLKAFSNTNYMVTATALTDEVCVGTVAYNKTTTAFTTGSGGHGGSHWDKAVAKSWYACGY